MTSFMNDLFSPWPPLFSPFKIKAIWKFGNLPLNKNKRSSKVKKTLKLKTIKINFRTFTSVSHVRSNQSKILKRIILVQILKLCRWKEETYFSGLLPRLLNPFFWGDISIWKNCLFTCVSVIVVGRDTVGLESKNCCFHWWAF